MQKYIESKFELGCANFLIKKPLNEFKQRSVNHTFHVKGLDPGYLLDFYLPKDCISLVYYIVTRFVNIFFV